MNAAIFTALDGTLLDFDTFDAGASRPLLQRLCAAGVPVIPISSMTLAELEPIARELGMHHAMIIEAGGAIARWRNGAWEVEPCGPDADVLLDVVAAVEAASGADLTVYSVLPEKEAACLSGRSGAMLRGSTERCFSEPFIVERGEIADVARAASALGFEVRRGARFFHLCRLDAEGVAFSRVRDELGCDFTIGIGGSPLDAEFLLRSDVPILVPRPNGELDPELRAALPDARIAPAPGSAGWAAAVEEAWRLLPGKASARARRPLPSRT
ncbi:MAG TPA: hypothetical protein VKB93_01200 [Thermoanaerobaculia bacterium]|nr:hypothetical protein [Thermoanaerobaculia bacterium]